jgi:serine/threonine-protein kinase
LRALSAVLLGIVLLMMLKSQLGPQAPPISIQSWSLLLVLLALTVLLNTPVRLGTAVLRTVEVVIFAWSALTALLLQYTRLVEAVQMGDPVQMATQHQHMVLPFILLIFLYALFVPASWKRAAIVIGAIALSVVGLRIALVMTYPELRDALNVEQATQAGAFLILGAVSAIIGSHVINGLRVEAFKSRQLGQYELVQKLGSGGMGEVWTARHRLLARPAAIKLIRSEMLGNTAQADNLVRRFEREAQATAALTSPHTITVFDFGVTNDRAFYYVMELLEGLDLATLVSRWGPLPAGRVIHLVAQACASLSEAHSRGLIHRDIKPSNLFACRIGNQSDFVKVLDFGLVKSADDLPLAGEQLTRLGGVAGTPGFMSPEQISGEQLDGRSDLYALGCVAYTLLTGELVFDGDGGLAVAVQHLKEDPIPPSRRTSLPIPTDLEAIVLSCLAKDRRQRPTDAASLGRSLLQCSAAQEWDEAKAQEWWLDQAGSSDNHSEGRIRTLSRSETLR